MKTTPSLLTVSLLALCVQAAPAQAQLARTFVSSLGNDANDCARATPCRTFQGAHDKALASGEITVLDPGGYGAVTITKSLSIINDGVGEAGVLVSGGLNGITVSAGAAGAVSLRGLTVKGIGFGGGNGIKFNSGKSLTIENCAVRNLDGSGVGHGVIFSPANTSTPPGTSSLAVSNTIVADNTGLGILVRPTGTGAAKATFSRVEVYNSGDSGLFVDGSVMTAAVNAVVADSVAANNSGAGFVVGSGPNNAGANLMVIRSVAANNGTGVQTFDSFAVLRVGQSSLTGNGTGWQNFGGGVLVSYGDNNIDGNIGGDFAPPSTAKR